MNKLIIILGVATMLAGCTVDQYFIEREYYRTLRQAQIVFKNPDATPPNELQRVVGLLEGFSKKYTDNPMAVDAQFNIARLYLVKKEYSNARARLAKTLTAYSKFENIASEAVFLSGNSYEMEDKWDSALEQYQKIYREYPTTLRGLDIPIYIIQHYKIKFQPDKMIDAAHQAITHYNALADKYFGSPLAYRALVLAADCYAVPKEWENAVLAHKKIIEAYKDKTDVSGAFMSIAYIYKNELKDDAKAKETLEQFIKEFPKSKIRKMADGLLKELK